LIRIFSMNNHLISSLALAAILVAGCSDPADKVHKSPATKATVTATAAATVAPASAGRQLILQSSSRIGFVGSKVTGSHAGGFTNFSGGLTVDGGKIVGSPEFTIDMASTWADDARLTGHLQSADFFDVPNHPTTTFKVTAITPGATNSTVTGNLTLHGIAKSVTFPAVISVAADAVSVKAEFAINRREFNINYAGRANDLIRDQVVIKLDLRAAPKG
jgi:polyisoprenoid-binding protein YceI